MKTYEELLAERDTLKYHLSRVLSAYGGNSGFEPSLSVFCRAIDEAREIINETPSQCLAEIKAEAGRAGFIAGSYLWCDYHTGSEHKDDLINDIKSDADQYATKVRQGEQGTWLKDSNVNGGKRQGGAE